MFKLKLMKKGRGELPYVVMWIGKHGLPSLTTCSTKTEAINQYIWLKQLHRQPSLLRGVEVIEEENGKTSKE